jgi:hypothetical protein
MQRSSEPSPAVGVVHERAHEILSMRRDELDGQCSSDRLGLGRWFVWVMSAINPGVESGAPDEIGVVAPDGVDAIMAASRLLGELRSRCPELMGGPALRAQEWINLPRGRRPLTAPPAPELVGDDGQRQGDCVRRRHGARLGRATSPVRRSHPRRGSPGPASAGGRIRRRPHHLRGVAATQGILFEVAGAISAPVYWEVECTLWVRWCFENMRLVSRVERSPADG